MFLPIPSSKWTTAIDRRKFIGGAAAAAAAATLSTRHAWADTRGAIPDTLTAVGGSGKPVTLTAADIKDLREVHVRSFRPVPVVIPTPAAPPPEVRYMPAPQPQVRQRNVGQPARQAWVNVQTVVRRIRLDAQDRLQQREA